MNNERVIIILLGLPVGQAQKIFIRTPLMAIPDFQTVMRPILAAVSSAPLTLSEVRERIADDFQLNEEERNERLPSGKQTVINNRVGWARTYLNKAGLLSIPAKG